MIFTADVTLSSHLVADKYACYLAVKVMRSVDTDLRPYLRHTRLAACTYDSAARNTVGTHVRILDISYSTFLNSSARAQLVLLVLVARETMNWPHV